jgi:hypothetical protein
LCQCVERAEDWTPAQTKVCGTDRLDSSLIGCTAWMESLTV